MAIISHKVEGVSNDVTHYARVYPVNKKGHAQSELDGQIASALTNAFPAEPSSYNLIGTYSSSQTFTAPEDGWFQIEVFGASGNGGSGCKHIAINWDGENVPLCGSGGGGGGSGFSCSVVKLKKGDKVEIIPGTIGSQTIVRIYSTLETYSDIIVTSAQNGGNGSYTTSPFTGVPGIGGAGGVGSGGNISNLNGGTGSNGGKNATGASISGGNGGSPAHTDGNEGGNGGRAPSSSGTVSGSAGKAGFIKIYRGDTNVVAA